MTNLISSASVKSDWQPSPWEVRIIVDCQCAHMTEQKTAALLGITPQTLARWHTWRIYWSARYTTLETIPEAAAVATPLEETVFKTIANDPEPVPKPQPNDLEPPPKALFDIGGYVQRVEERAASAIPR